MEMIILYSFIIFITIIILICCLTLILEHIIKKYRYGIMYFQFIYFIFSLGNNKTKYIIKNNDKKYFVIRFEEDDIIKCDICDLSLEKITNKVLIDNKEKEFILNDYLMTFKCCKYTKKICKKCFLTYFYTKFNKINRSLFSNFNCIYCTQQVYILQLETEFIKILVNN